MGAFQFAPRFRRKRLGWHRMVGRVLVPAGLVAALSGAPAMTISIVLGFLAIRRRDIVGHRAWMIRGYAIGLGAGTQAVTIATVMAIAGGTHFGSSPMPASPPTTCRSE